MRVADVPARRVSRQRVRPHASRALPTKPVEPSPEVLSELREDIGRGVAISQPCDEKAEYLPAVAFEKHRRRALLVARITERANARFQGVASRGLHKITFCHKLVLRRSCRVRHSHLFGWTRVLCLECLECLEPRTHSRPSLSVFTLARTRLCSVEEGDTWR